MSTRHYNPDWLDDDALLAGFIARQGEFRFLRDELSRAPRQGSAQHYLLIGQRGAGKTTLLKRLAIAIRREAELNDHLVALSFPEELYQVKNLEDFWWAACEALADELERQGKRQQADQLFERIDGSRQSSSTTTSAGLQTLLDGAAEIERRPVLLVDNLDLVFERIDKKGRKLKDPLSPAYWALREALSTTTSPIVIGGSVRLSEPFTDYDKAFYDFFVPKRLGRLSLEEVRAVLAHLADNEGSPDIKKRLHERPARIDALYDLTGGNPRAISFIFQLLRQGPGRRAVEDFEGLMDITTPYYKARFEDLSEQAQIVMHALAVRRKGEGEALHFGHTAAALASHAGLPTNTVSAQLDVLEREGLVEKSAASRRTQYRIAEQLFRLWLQMRGSRRIRQNVIGLAEFLEAMYDREELTAQLKQAGQGMRAAQLAFAIADTEAAAPLRRGLEAFGTDCLTQALGNDQEECTTRLPDCDLSPAQAALRALQNQLKNSMVHDLTPAEQDALLGSLELRLPQKEAHVAALCQPEPVASTALQLRQHFAGERQRLQGLGLAPEDQARLFSLHAKGFLPLPLLTTGDAEVLCHTQHDPALITSLWRLVGAREFVKFDARTAQAWLDWGQQHAVQASATEWANVAGSFRRSGQLPAASQALTLACQRGETSRTRYEQACLLDAEGKPEEAEQAYRNAIALDSHDLWTRNSLGCLLAEQPDRQDKAEAAYREAIELYPSDALSWNNLGVLLAKQPDRQDEAEAAYREAIELNPSDALPWNNLGVLLANQSDRQDEAEAAYREAIALNPGYASPWNGLGNLLYEQPDRQDETEATYRQAIELNPSDARSWNNLGNLLAKQADRQDETEAAYREAISLDPNDGTAWGNLGLYFQRQGKFAEAQEALAKAVKLDQEYSNQWQVELSRLQAQPLRQSAQKAVRTGNLAELRASIEQLLAQPAGTSATLADDAFIREVLAPALADQHQGAAVLGLLWGLGLDRHARPLLLAFAAALEKRPQALDDLEPEVRGAARHVYTQLVAAR